MPGQTDRVRSDFGIEAGPTMKAVVILLCLLAALKLGHHEYLYRAATHDVIVTAYRDRAAIACQSNSRTASLGLTALAWTQPRSIRLVIGKGGLDVQLWQVDSELWSARYRHPFLVLTTGSRGSQAYCEYDIVNAAATVARL